MTTTLPIHIGAFRTLSKQAHVVPVWIVKKNILMQTYSCVDFSPYNNWNYIFFLLSDDTGDHLSPSSDTKTYCLLKFLDEICGQLILEKAKAKHNNNDTLTFLGTLGDARLGDHASV